MSHVDDVAKEVSPKAHLVGLWLATHHISSISPSFGMILLDVAVACDEQLVSETNKVIIGDVSQFICALRMVSEAALVQHAVILDQLDKALGLAQNKEEPHV